MVGRDVSGSGDGVTRVRATDEGRLRGAELDDVVLVRADEDGEVAFLDGGSRELEGSRGRDRVDRQGRVDSDGEFTRLLRLSSSESLAAGRERQKGDGRKSECASAEEKFFDDLFHECFLLR